MGREWWHNTWSTYGTWLPGDERGLRARRHKIHSSGDYKSPPPVGEHAGLLAYSKRLMSKPEVVLDRGLQERAMGAIVEKAETAGIPMAVLAVGRTHVHALLAQDQATGGKDVAKLKRHSSNQLRDAVPGKLWGAGFDPRSIWDDEHHWEVVRYILDHARKERAVVWVAPRLRGDREERSGGGKP